MWESHPGEAQLHVRAPSPEQVFEKAIDAFSRLVELDSGGAPAAHDIEVKAADLGALLVELLGELVFLADTEGFVTDRATVSLEGDRLQAHLEGRRTALDPLVKAATYHDLRFERTGEGWDARVVLDV